MTPRDELLEATSEPVSADAVRRKPVVLGAEPPVG